MDRHRQQLAGIAGLIVAGSLAAGPLLAQDPTKPIHWYVDSTADLYRDAVERNMPFVLVFMESGPWTDSLVAALKGCDVIQRLEPVVLFGMAHPSKDVVARNMATALGLKNLPTTSLLEPDPKIISELGRIEGFEPASQFTEDIVRRLGPKWPNAVKPLSGYSRPVPWRPGLVRCWP